MVLGEFLLTLSLVALGAVLFAGPLRTAKRKAVARATTLSGGGAAEPGNKGCGGFAYITLDPRSRQIRYQISVTGVERAREAEIHESPPGKPGSVIIRLKPLSDGYAAGSVGATRSLIQKISKNPSAYYVSVHDAEHPDGVLTGQL